MSFKVAKKFDLPTLDIKVYDETRTEIDEAFEYILKQQDIGVLEIVIPTASVDGKITLRFNDMNPNESAMTYRSHLTFSELCSSCCKHFVSHETLFCRFLQF